MFQMDPRYEVTKDIKTQLNFIQELDKLEKKRHEEQEREILLRAIKVSLWGEINWEMPVSSCFSLYFDITYF